MSSKAKAMGQSEEPTMGEAIQKTAQKWAPAFRIMILLCIFVVAFFVRIFSVNFQYFLNLPKIHPFLGYQI